MALEDGALEDALEAEEGAWEGGLREDEPLLDEVVWVAGVDALDDLWAADLEAGRWALVDAEPEVVPADPEVL